MPSHIYGQLPRSTATFGFDDDKTNQNICTDDTCKARIGFELDRLQLEKGAERGTFKTLVDKRLAMVITQWKDSKTLQTVSTVMCKDAQTIQCRNGSTIIDVTCPNDIVMYQNNMGDVDHGDQHKVIGSSFDNVAHFKKWYKQAFLGIADFSLLQAFTVSNLSAHERYESRRGNANVKRKK